MRLSGLTIGAISLAILLTMQYPQPAFSAQKVLAKTKPTPNKAVRKSNQAVGKSSSVATTRATKKTTTVARRTTRRAAAPKLPTYGNPAEGDDISRDNPVVRAAAVKALGNFMGSMVVVNPENGKILSIVNQKLALESGYQPCSSFKPAVALAALGDGIIENDSNRIKLGKQWYLDLEHALAKSNNLYFESLGRALGLERLQYYARLFGFGEAATIGLGEESHGVVPEKAPSKAAGGVGKVASFGEGIAMTTLQMASFTSALANGGRLYYLQYPEQGQPFTPRLKRELPIADSLNPVREGMEGAVLSGTARRANIPDVHLLGKTGTCSEGNARLGWFSGYSDSPGKMAVVVLLRTGVKLGGGPRASGVAGNFFRQLAEQDYFTSNSQPAGPTNAMTASVTLGTLR